MTEKWQREPNDEHQESIVDTDYDAVHRLGENVFLRWSPAKRSDPAHTLFIEFNPLMILSNRREKKTNRRDILRAAIGRAYEFRNRRDRTS